MNNYNPNIHHRKSIRLKGYDYTQAGLYFITICCQYREHLFGEITDGEMILNDAGKMEYIVMPNHFHAILEIVGATLVVAQNDTTVAQNDVINQNDDVINQKGQPQGIAPTKTVGDMMDAFKSITTVEYIRGVKTLGWKPFDGKIWQRNYHEHIIRNEQSYQTISEYIINNPAKWTDDKFYIS
jgi:REP element-mobilizing transposase RayT